MPTLKNTAKSYKPSRSQKKKSSNASVTRATAGWWMKEPKKMKGMQLCDNCGAVYYDGHWHTSPSLSALLKSAGKKARHEAVLCVQCRWASGKSPRGGKPGFEGELTLDGLDHIEEKAEILATIRNFAKRATKRDPEDHIVAIDDRGPRVIITTTENQLAVGLGKAVDSAHKGGTLRIVWSDNDLPARVYWKRKA